MADNLGHVEEKGSRGRLFLPSLAFSYFAAGPLGVLVSLLLIDIGETFGVSEGVMGQINTLYSIVAVVIALLMGILSLRFKHKSLLLMGLLFIGISALGCLVAPDFNWMLVSYSLSGLGWAMVSPMCVTMIGEHFPLEKRASAVGWIVAGGALPFVIGAPLIASIAGVGGWRLAIIGFVIPILLASLLLAFISLPSISHSHRPAVNGKTYLKSFKGVLSGRSPIACLIGDALRQASFIAILIYGASFFMRRFLVSIDFASIWILGAASCYTLGSLVSGPIVNRFGRKTSTVLTAFLAGIFTITYACVFNLWLSLTLSFIDSWFFGMVTSAANSLTLEQVPEFRGTMMSIDTAAINLGSAFGTALGGLALLSFGYEGLGIVLGVMGVAAAVVFYLLTTDPTRKRN
ncbi:MAG: MFS transporter [Candidatus Bathyarchaeota archaeon]|nr:MFS transporter [Candidatus Bathyarchaeota archaeon]